MKTNEERTKILLAVPNSLLKKIDKQAAAQYNKRTGFIIKILSENVKDTREE